MRYHALAMAAAISAAAFDGTDAGRRAIVGSWQGVTATIALVVPADPSAPAVYIDEKGRAEGSVVVHEVIANTVRFSVGDRRLVMYVTAPGGGRIGSEGSEFNWSVRRVDR